MNFSGKLKTELNGLLKTVLDTYNKKENIRDREELTAAEKKQREKALRKERKEEIQKRKQKIRKHLRENKIDPDQIPENEPSSSKEVAKAQRNQTRAKERLKDLEGKHDIARTVEKEMEDPSLPDSYKSELWKLAKTKIKALGGENESSMTRMQRLRREHLMDSETVGKIRKTEAIEDIKGQVNFAMNYLDNHLDEYIFSNNRNPRMPDNREELEEQLKAVYSPTLEEIEERIEEHKPEEAGS